MINVNSARKYSNPRWNRKNIIKVRRLNQKFRKSKSKQTWLHPKKVETCQSYGTFKFLLLKTCLLSCHLNIKKKKTGNMREHSIKNPSRVRKILLYMENLKLFLAYSVWSDAVSLFTWFIGHLIAVSKGKWSICI